MKIAITTNKKPFTMINTAPRSSAFVKLGAVPEGGLRAGSWRIAGPPGKEFGNC